MYKLVALDMDGTLLTNNKEVSERNRQAIAKAQSLIFCKINFSYIV